MFIFLFHIFSLFLTDNVVKVWKIFPNTAEALNLMMSFFCAHPPTKMNVLLSHLIVVFQQPETATYSIVVHNLRTKGDVIIIVVKKCSSIR